MAIKTFQIDKNMAIVKWENLEDMVLLANIIRENKIQLTSINKELWE